MRIVGGEFRSRTLEAPKGTLTRPTTDRVREALFSILEARMSLHGIRVLDLYAGSGALGLEALSRGAAHCAFVEQDRAAMDALNRNIVALALTERTRVLRAKVGAVAPAWYAAATAQLVFADPPYADVHPHAVVALARIRALLANDPERTWVLEHGAKSPTPAIDGLIHVESRRYGDTALAFYTDGEISV
jgi:16S rRNA (guanine966-N2)-methyltransferase